MDGIVVLLAVLAGGAVLAGILAFVILSAVASLVDILAARLAGAGFRYRVTAPATPAARGCDAPQAPFRRAPARSTPQDAQ